MNVTKERLRVRKREEADFNERAREAERADAELPGLREQLARYEERQAFFAGLGEAHLEVPQSSVYRNMGMVEWQPVRSKLNGIQLAEKVQPKIDEIAGVIAAREKAIKDLLAA